MTTISNALREVQAVKADSEMDSSGTDSIKIIFEEAVDTLSFDEIYICKGDEGIASVDTEREITGSGLEWIVPVAICTEGTVMLSVDKVGISAKPIAVNVEKQKLDSYGYRPNGYDSANWMRRLADSTDLRKISMPGTHDSATYGVIDADVPDMARCQYQSKNITQQLKDGIRFFDLRVGSDGKLHHGHVICYDSYPNGPVTIEKVFNNIVAFLDGHPGETVLVLIKHEYGDNTHDYLEYVNSAINRHRDRVYTGTSTHLKLSDIRNKIVLLDGGGNLGKGINASAMHGGSWGNNGTIYWQNFYDIGDWTMTVNKRAELKAHEVKVFNENIIKYDTAGSLLCFNWWNKAWNVGTSVLYYAGKIESYFYGKWNGRGKLYYPQGVQIMDYYNNDLVYEVIESNWNS
ncbi:MAG: hypothetical protein LBJ00_04825 [Planctomycetaceae bacterium]|jgi:cytochrome b involved in lipid metabolism|nr:hypothetical protein [Planctomycetaceae bacterium]